MTVYSSLREVLRDELARDEGADNAAHTDVCVAFRHARDIIELTTTYTRD